MTSKFNVGDSVVIVANKERGSIQSINALLGEGENLYEVKVGEATRLYKESYLELFISHEQEAFKNNELKNLSLQNVGVSIEVEEEIASVIARLELETSQNAMIQLANACKLQKYMATRCESLEDNRSNTSDILVDELYKGLIKKENNCLTNSYTFSEILKRVGMHVLNVVLKDENNSFYMANLVLIDGLYYYFDTTLEKEIFSEAQNQSRFVLCSAGVGSKRYENFYTPLSIIDLHYGENKSIPGNISENDLDIKVINRMIGVEI